MTFKPYQTCLLCSGKAQPGTVALMDYTMDLFVYAGSLGIYNCRNVAGSTTKSQHACGRAWDCGLATNPDGSAITELGFPIIQFLAKWSTEFGIVELIYARVIYDDASPNGRYYGGVHPHNDHIHITQFQTQAASLTYEDYVAFTGIDPRQTGAFMSFLPLAYGHGFPIPPSDSALVGDQSYKLQDVILLQNYLMRVGAPFDNLDTDPNNNIDGRYGNFTVTQVAKYIGGNGKGVSGWGWDNLVMNAAAVVARSEITKALTALPPSGGLTAAEVDAMIDASIKATKVTLTP